jgi:hypothetical protein
MSTDYFKDLPIPPEVPKEWLVGSDFAYFHSRLVDLGMIACADNIDFAAIEEAYVRLRALKAEGKEPPPMIIIDSMPAAFLETCLAREDYEKAMKEGGKLDFEKLRPKGDPLSYAIKASSLGLKEEDFVFDDVGSRGMPELPPGFGLYTVCDSYKVSHRKPYPEIEVMMTDGDHDGDSMAYDRRGKKTKDWQGKAYARKKPKGTPSPLIQKLMGGIKR